MTTMPSASNSPVRLFMRHVVPIWLVLQKQGKEHSVLISSFVVSIQGDWFLVTAGHCLQEVEEQRSRGYRIERCHLVDNGSYESRFAESIPFDFIGASPRHLGDDFFDYGVLAIADNTKSLLESNGIVAMSEDVWDKQPASPDRFLLLGVPASTVTATKDHAHFSAALLSVEEISPRPECFEPNNAPTFYGRIPSDEQLSDIAGMSGGPVFSLKRDTSGETKYWLHAVQSRWVKGPRLIAACRTTPFIRWIRESLYR